MLPFFLTKCGLSKSYYYYYFLSIARGINITEKLYGFESKKN